MILFTFLDKNATITKNEKVICCANRRNTYTLLRQDATLKQIKEICDDGVTYNTANVCIPPAYVKDCADFIKTSTGFSTAGATFEDIELFARNIDKNVRMKAAGGIKSLDNAQKFLELGAQRLGTSTIVAIAKKEENGN